MKCPECGLDWYFNMAAAVAAVIFDEQGRLLLTVRAHEPSKGMLDLPGGFVDMGETAEQAVKRELLEELCIDVEPVEYLGSFPNEYVYSGILYETLDLVFICRANHLEGMTPGDDVSGVVRIKPEEIVPDDAGLSSVKEILISVKKRFAKE